jgi:hypothetical protein
VGRAPGGRGRVGERHAPGAGAGDADDICGPHLVSRRIWIPSESRKDARVRLGRRRRLVMLLAKTPARA